MEIKSEMLDFGFGEVNDNNFKKIKEERQTQVIDISQLDYILGDIKKEGVCSSARMEMIKSIEDIDNRIFEMSLYLEKEVIKQPFPKEFYDWYSREVLGLQFKKWELKQMKRDYKIKRNREIKEEKDNKKIEKKKSKQLQYTKKNVLITF
tara:strand:- start:5094 stop:5543 length:450 start_codon:yes stop_codon:yes gene_type:complete